METPREAASLIREMKQGMENDIKARIILFFIQTGLLVEGVDLFYSSSLGGLDELVQVDTKVKL